VAILELDRDEVRKVVRKIQDELGPQWAQAIITAELVAELLTPSIERIVEAIKPPVVEVIRPEVPGIPPVTVTLTVPAYETKFEVARNRSIAGEYPVLDVEERGFIVEFFSEALSPDYNINLATNMGRFKMSYSELREISEYLDDIDAYEVDGKYVVRLRNIYFTTCRLSITTTTSIEFPWILVKWNRIV